MEEREEEWSVLGSVKECIGNKVRGGSGFGWATRDYDAGEDEWVCYGYGSVVLGCESQQ